MYLRSRVFRHLAPIMCAGLTLAACGGGDPPAATNNDDAALIAASGNPRVASAVQTGRDLLLSTRDKLGLDANHDFAARTALVDDAGEVHVRYQQTYRGVAVWEGETIVHQGNAKRATEVTSDVKSGINLGTAPSLSTADVLRIAHRELHPVGPYAHPPTAELIVYAHTREQVRAAADKRSSGELNAVDMERVTTGYSLAYHVQTALENGTAETRHVDYIIEAHTGAILKQWESLQTTAATGTGYSQFSGTVSLNTNTIAGGYEMRDVVTSMNYATYNLDHGTSGQGTIYTDTDNIWGDGANYTPGGSTTTANGQTAAVDAHYGVGRTAAYYSSIHSRNGIDGAGTPTYSRVHYYSNYDNAFWDDSCFCMTYGDGNSFKTLTSIDVAGHEMAHGVTSHTANLTYSGESGGLNESMSDINGTMVEFYARGGSGSTIGNSGGNWTIGEQLSATPLRYMYKPSKDGASPDAWSSTIGGLDVHYSSGPSNRMFYFLSQGASSTSTSDFYSTFRPCGLTGVGNDHAARIAYRALSVYMTASTNYAAARTAYLNAASDLYGGTASTDYAAVQNAFNAINVGAGATPCGVDGPAQMSSPTPGSTLAGSAVTFSWTTGSGGASQYYLYVGSSFGAFDLYAASQGLATSGTVTGLPTDGRTLYVRLWSLIGSAWQFRDYTYTATNLAAIYSPAPGSALAGSTVTFSWTTGTGVSLYYLYVGSSFGAYDLYAASQGLATSGTVTGLPTDGRTLYVRLWSLIGSAWQFRDYTYTAASLPAIYSPAPGSTLAGSSATFSWTSGSGVSLYYLYVGSSFGSGDLYAASQGLATSGTVTGLPTDGRTLYVRLWSLIGSGWQFLDYTYTAAIAAVPATLYSPAPGSSLGGSTATFSWTTGSGVSLYYLYVGSSFGNGDLYAASQGLATSGTVTGLPTDGRTLYVRLWSLIGSAWQFRDYTYTAFRPVCVANTACTVDLSMCSEAQKAPAWQGQTSLQGTMVLAYYTSHLNWVCQTSIPQAWPVIAEPGWWCGTVVNQCSCSAADGCH